MGFLRTKCSDKLGVVRSDTQIYIFLETFYIYVIHVKNSKLFDEQFFLRLGRLKNSDDIHGLSEQVVKFFSNSRLLCEI